MDHLCYECLMFVMLSLLFIAALWSPALKELTSWLLFVIFHCVFVTFPCGILGQVRYLIVLIPDHCHLSYFEAGILFELYKYLVRSYIPLVLCRVVISGTRSKNINGFFPPQHIWELASKQQKK